MAQQNNLEKCAVYCVIFYHSLSKTRVVSENWVFFQEIPTWMIPWERKAGHQTYSFYKKDCPCVYFPASTRNITAIIKDKRYSAGWQRFC